MDLSKILTLGGCLLTIGGIIAEVKSGKKLKDEFNDDELDEIEIEEFEEIDEEA